MEFYNSYRINFEVDLDNKDFISTAQLRLKKFFLQLNDTMLENVRRARKDLVEVHLVTTPANYGGKEKHVFVTTEYLTLDYTSRVAVLNVTEAIILWLDLPPSSLLELDIQIGCSGSLLNGSTLVPNYQFFEDSDNDGLLILRSYQKKNENKNNLEKKQDINEFLNFCKDNKSECCLTKYRINFELDLNWTWIARPKAIAFNYCKGDCSEETSFFTEHDKYLNAVSAKNSTFTTKPCCVPNSYADVELVFYFGGKFYHQNLVDGVVTSCKCRY